MSTFQKIIAIFTFFAMGLAGYYLYHQEQIRKNEVASKETQKQISDCKYLLSNKDLILEKETKDLEVARVIKDTSQNAPRPEYAEQSFDHAFQTYIRANSEYEQSAEKCRSRLRLVE